MSGQTEGERGGGGTDPWESLDWAALDRLRRGFLAQGEPGAAGAGVGAYWTGPGDLHAYNLTFGERIGWKWDAVLVELARRGWRPPGGGPVLDFGCGSGIASRRVLGAFGPGVAEGDGLLLWDHSPEACAFAEEKAVAAFPGLPVATVTLGYLEGDAPLGLLVVSHVITELDAPGLERLVALAGRAQAVLWVEPGTSAASRALGAVRERLIGAFEAVAPCTHGGPCPIQAPGAERHWCHHFASPPAGVFADPRWVRFGQRAGIDLRSLPYSFVALERRGVRRREGRATNGSPAPGAPTSNAPAQRHGTMDRGEAGAPAAQAGTQPPPPWTPGAWSAWSRVIGRADAFKPYTRVLSCDAGGLAELTVFKRDYPALIKALDRTRAPLVYRWTRAGDRILGAEGPGLPSPGA